MLWISVDAWQVQCCGEPFGVGDVVRWTLVERPSERRGFAGCVVELDVVDG